MKITKFGHSCILVEEKKIRILIYPGIYSTLQNEVENVDVILITYEHPDHLDPDSLQAFRAFRNQVRGFGRGKGVQILKRDYAIYHVAFKILLRRSGRILILKTADDKYLDLPGGRIDSIEDRTPLLKILDREVREELGNKIKYQVGKPLFQFRRFIRMKHAKIFITVYGARYISGKLKLSSEHSTFQWVNPKKLKIHRSDFFSKEEYVAFKKFLSFIGKIYELD